MESSAENLRYPVGRYSPPTQITPEYRAAWIADIEILPRQLRDLVGPLDDAQLDTPYRPGGWTVRQVVHHLPDSHLNSYVRFRLALTEDCPTIKPYEEGAWAELTDAKSGPIPSSLELLSSLHQRWVALLRSLAPSDLQRRFRHPDRGEVTLDWNLGLYAWHGRHHLGHIAALRQREGW